MIKRTLEVPEDHFFLFGPRGTGKSTWLKEVYKPHLEINLLLSSEFLKLSADPGLLRKKVEGLPKGSRVVIDEIQKLPELLDEVHALIFDYKNEFQFALSGSSARKLKRNNANLLAGRSLSRSLFTITTKELNYNFSIEDSLKFGMLPRIFSLESDQKKIDYLYSYVDLYLKEEIQQEAAVRNLNSYHRYLKHAAIMNGQTLNISSLSRDAAVARSTADGYFQITQETLLGFFLPSIQLKAKVKEVHNPKFYFFDTGVVRALQDKLDEPLNSDKGFLFETFLINEIRAYLSYNKIRGEIGYWGVPSGNEVDLVWKKGASSVGFEFKYQENWKREFNSGLNVLLSKNKIKKAYGVYLGKSPLKFDSILVLPIKDFLNSLHSHEIIS